MATTIQTAATWKIQTPATSISLRKTWLAFADGQSKYKTFWFLLSLILQGVFFLPLPAVLSFYYHAPYYIVGITLTLFFANIIAGMGGSGIRTLLALFALSIFVHLAMAVIYIL